MNIVNNIYVIQENNFFEKQFIVTYQGSVSFPVKSKALSLREKFPKTELFLVRIFLYRDLLQRFTA